MSFAVLVAAVLCCGPGLVLSQEQEEEGSSIGDLLKKVKDIKVPESVSGLPEQITELKESYLETAATVDELRQEVEMLRQEVYDLRKMNEELSAAVGTQVKAEGIAALMKPTEISATELVDDYVDDRAAADENYLDRYLKVVGIIDKIETGTQSVVFYLRAEGHDALVRCPVLVGPDFYVEALPAQGRIISRNDRSVLLSVGQPIGVIGTCKGISLNVEMANGRVDGVVERRAAPASTKK